MAGEGIQHVLIDSVGCEGPDAGGLVGADGDPSGSDYDLSGADDLAVFAEGDELRHLGVMGVRPPGSMPGSSREPCEGRPTPSVASGSHHQGRSKRRKLRRHGKTPGKHNRTRHGPSGAPTEGLSDQAPAGCVLRKYEPRNGPPLYMGWLPPGVYDASGRHTRFRSYHVGLRSEQEALDLVMGWLGDNANFTPLETPEGTDSSDTLDCSLTTTSSLTDDGVGDMS